MLPQALEPEFLGGPFDGLRAAMPVWAWPGHQERAGLWYFHGLGLTDAQIASLGGDYKLGVPRGVRCWCWFQIGTVTTIKARERTDYAPKDGGLNDA